MKTRMVLLLAVLCSAGALVVASAVEDTVPVPVHEPGTASEGCSCDGETEGCTGDCETCPECACEDGDCCCDGGTEGCTGDCENFPECACEDGDCCCDGGTEGCTGDCDDCDAEPSDVEDCHGGSPHGQHCGGCH